MSEQVRIAAHPTRGTIAVRITDDDRLLVLREMPVSEGWKELFRMREDGRRWDDVLDRAAKLRPGIDLETVKLGLGKMYGEMESRLHAMAHRRARLLP